MKWTTKLFVKDIDNPVVVYLTSFKPTIDQLSQWIINHGKATKQEVIDFDCKQTS